MSTALNRSILGNLLYAVATKTTAATENRRKLLAEYVTAEKITSSAQLDLALEYLKGKAGVENIDTNDFDKSIGVSFSSMKPLINRMNKGRSCDHR